MRWIIHAATSLHRDQRGQVSIEWVMLMVAFALPMMAVFYVLFNVLREHYRMVTFLETLPFP